jgi:hypothetical protein
VERTARSLLLKIKRNGRRNDWDRRVTVKQKKRKRSEAEAVYSDKQAESCTSGESKNGHGGAGNIERTDKIPEMEVAGCDLPAMHVKRVQISDEAVKTIESDRAGETPARKKKCKDKSDTKDIPELRVISKFVNSITNVFH